jgi:molybdopterin-containing oxidoreductase family membrane subunit
MVWSVGLIPDLATLRDRATNPLKKRIYGIFALGWRGSAKHWRRYNQAYYLLAALAAPLVVSVHTIVSFDFAVGIVPGWHSTIYPPFFVAGAIFSGFAMVLTLTIPLRAVYDLKGMITMRHLENMAKVMLVSGMVVGYGYIMEVFGAWYSGNQFEIAAAQHRFFGDYAPFYWAMIICNVVIPQLIWIKSMRTNVYVLWVLSIIINIGMWLERFVIVTTLSSDFLPSAWQYYTPTFWDWSIYIGTFGLFFTLLFLFLRYLPAISIFEMRELVEHHKHHH